MPASIGLRVYRVFITKEADTTPISFEKDDVKCDPYVFIHNYLTDEKLKISNEEAQRSWHIEDITYSSADGRNYYGVMRYGIFGFESTLVDTKTAEVVHDRKQNHAEVIPLAFHVWSPVEDDWSYMTMQSFQGRSCVTVVQEAISEAFKKENPGYRLRFVKISPGDGEGKALHDKQVREVRLLKKSNPTDLSDVYSGKVKLSSAKYLVSIQAPRKKSLGSLKDVKDYFTGKKKLNDGSVIEYEGNEFEEVSAEVRVGKKTRVIGVFGYNNDAGVIDITSELKFDDSGHPNISSVYKESNEILIDIHSVLKLKK